MPKSRANLLAIAAALSVAGLVSFSAGTGTLTVCPSGCQFSRIQDAINAAQPGDTIEIKAGTYEENLTVTKSVKLIGEGRDVVTIKGAQPGKPGIAIAGDIEVTLAGLTVAETLLASPKNFQEDGVRVTRSVKLTLTQVRLLKNGDSGLELRDRSQAAVTDSEFIGNGNNGIGLFDSAQILVTNSKIIMNGSGLADNFNNGLSAVGRNKVTLQQSEISGNTNEGVFLGQDVEATLIGNTITKNKMNGIVLLDAVTAELKENSIRENNFWGVTEVLTQCGFGEDRFDGTVTGENNEIAGNGRGLPDALKQQGDGTGDVCPKELEFLKKK
jgi:parallel beta-helix repeat protein